MKKLMIAITLICATAMAQAASVKWTSAASSSYEGKNLYLLTIVGTTYDSLDAFAKSAIDFGVVEKAGMSYKVAQRTTANNAITKTANYYLAVVDGNTIHYLDVTDTFRQNVYAPPENSPGQASVAFADVANSTTTATIGGDPGPAPEPTSGLLLIFGVAGLALRRRVQE